MCAFNGSLRILMTILTWKGTVAIFLRRAKQWDRWSWQLWCCRGTCDTAIDPVYIGSNVFGQCGDSQIPEQTCRELLLWVYICCQLCVLWLSRLRLLISAHLLLSMKITAIQQVKLGPLAGHFLIPLGSHSYHFVQKYADSIESFHRFGAPVQTARGSESWRRSADLAFEVNPENVVSSCGCLASTVGWDCHTLKNASELKKGWMSYIVQAIYINVCIYCLKVCTLILISWGQVVCNCIDWWDVRAHPWSSRWDLESRNSKEVKSVH